MTVRIKFDLVANAFDYLHSAASYAVGNEPRSLKYAVLHLASAIELILKARLIKDHWSLVFLDTDKASKASLASGDFASVDLDRAIARLASVAGVSISEPDQKQLRHLRKLRNRVQHFDIEIDKRAITAVLGDGYHFALDFCKNHLADDVEQHQEALADAFWKLTEFDGFIEARLAAIREELARHRDLTTCPYCRQETVVIGDGPPHCLFCDHRPAASELAEVALFAGSVEECPECGDTACAIVYCDAETSTDHWRCFACGNDAVDYLQCTRCGRLYDGEAAVCDECLGAMMEKDD